MELESKAFGASFGRPELLLFACPKRSNQEKGHPGEAPSGHPALRVRAAVVGSADGASMHRQRPRAHPARAPAGDSTPTAPPRRGPGWRPSWPQKPQPARLRRFGSCLCSSLLNPLSARAEQRRQDREQGAHVRGHGWPSSRRPDHCEQRRASRRHRLRDAGRGCPSLCLLSLGQARESKLRPEGARKLCSKARLCFKASRSHTALPRQNPFGQPKRSNSLPEGQ